MKRLVIPALLMLFANVAGPAQGQSPALVAGKDYTEISNGSPLEPAEGKIVVEEFFNYICPACNGFEPAFAAWAAKLPPYAKMVRIPATFRPDFMQYAKAYYAAESFGIVDKTHRAVYDGVHVSHKLPAEGDKPNEERIAEFYSDFGVGKTEFLSAMQSFGVDVKIRRATEHMKKSKVPSTPTLVVNGRYLVKGDSYDEMLRNASALIEKEHAK
jgi:thiol:disulfide interchange protein DsbA